MVLLMVMLYNTADYDDYDTDATVVAAADSDKGDTYDNDNNVAAADDDDDETDDHWNKQIQCIDRHQFNKSYTWTFNLECIWQPCNFIVLPMSNTIRI